MAKSTKPKSMKQQMPKKAQMPMGKMMGPMMMSHLPKGVSQSPKGDIGEHRQLEAREQRTFKGAKDVRTGFKRMTDNTAHDGPKEYKKRGSLPIMSNPQNTGRYTGAPRVANPNEPSAPAKYRPAFALPQTKQAQSNEKPVRGEGPAGNSNSDA